MVIPGLGQIYNGQIAIGLFMMALTIGLYFVVIGFLFHIALIFDAYNYAKKFNEELRSRNSMRSFDWKADLQQWLSVRRDISQELADSIIIFFEIAF